MSNDPNSPEYNPFDLFDNLNLGEDSEDEKNKTDPMADLMDNLTDMVKDGELADALEKWIDELFSSFSSDALAPDSATNPLSMAAAELNAEGNSAPLDNNQSDKRPQLEKDEILDDAAALVI